MELAFLFPLRLLSYLECCTFLFNDSYSILFNSLPGYHSAPISQTYISSKPQSTEFLFILNKINVCIVINKYYEDQK